LTIKWPRVQFTSKLGTPMCHRVQYLLPSLLSYKSICREILWLNTCSLFT